MLAPVAARSNKPNSQSSRLTGQLCLVRFLASEGVRRPRIRISSRCVEIRARSSLDGLLKAWCSAKVNALLC